MITLPASTDVLIVGAGPAGLALGCTLAAQGVSFAIVDRLEQGVNTSRAAVIHARTLEVLDELGVTERLVRAGHIVPRFTVRDRDRVLVTITFDRLATPHPYTLMLPQQETERILEGRLQELGAAVCRGWSLQRLRMADEGVVAEIGREDDAPRETRARYVVGADGMHSRVRQEAGIPFVGDVYQQSFVLADIRMTWPLDQNEVMLFFSPNGLVVVAPLPGGRHRVVATMDEAPEHPGLQDVQHLLDTRGPASQSARVHEVIWGSRFRVHRRLAERYRAGRILLAGDAAHVHSPAGGQGMNTGIQDAVMLGHALGDVLRGRRDERALDDYERARRPVATRVLDFTDRMTRVATVRTPRRRAMRNFVMGAVGRTVVRHWMASELAGLRHR